MAITQNALRHRRELGSYLAQARTFTFPLPLVGQFATQPPQEILTPEQTQARQVSIVATMIQTTSKFNVRLAPSATGQVLPLVMFGYNQGKLAQAEPGLATLLPMDVVVALPVPPGKRIWANFRGDQSSLTVIPGGYSILVSVWVSAYLEATVEGEGSTERLIDALEALGEKFEGGQQQHSTATRRGR